MWTTNDIPDQTGKKVVITGANTGIGFETAKALYKKGAQVILACRNPEKAKLATEQILEAGGPGKLEYIPLDLSVLASVKEFAKKVQRDHAQLHLLINNAAIMTPPRSLTKDGYELQFGVNFLAHFALTVYLYPVLQKTGGSRIVTVTSLAYTYGKIDFGNLRTEISYDGFTEYCQSKLANLLFTRELQRRIALTGDSVTSVAAHPGVSKTELARHMKAEDIARAIESFGPPMDADQGALSNLFAAVSPSVKGGGLYGPHEGLRGHPTFVPVQQPALDLPAALRLWEMAEQAIGVHFSL